MSKINRDPSIRGEVFDVEPGSGPDRVVDEPALTGVQRDLDPCEAAQHNVWDEPALRAADIKAPPGAVTYSGWYRERLARASLFRSWSVTLFLVLVGGPFAVLGAFFTSYQAGFVGLLSAVVVGPALEEVLKIGATMIMLENRPYLFRSSIQLMIAVVASALVFAAIENLFYIHLFRPEGAELFQYWRWTVCMGLHAGATAVAGLGLVRAWRASQPDPATILAEKEYSKPRLELAYPYIVAAVVLHGAYNA